MDCASVSFRLVNTSLFTWHSHMNGYGKVALMCEIIPQKNQTTAQCKGFNAYKPRMLHINLYNSLKDTYPLIKILFDKAQGRWSPHLHNPQRNKWLRQGWSDWLCACLLDRWRKGTLPINLLVLTRHPKLKPQSDKFTLTKLKRKGLYQGTLAWTKGTNLLIPRGCFHCCSNPNDH